MITSCKLDIECAGRKGHFPEPEHDPVIQIANMVTIQGLDSLFSFFPFFISSRRSIEPFFFKKKKEKKQKDEEERRRDKSK